MRDEETRFDEAVRDNAVYGVLPEGTTLETLREKGYVRFDRLGHRRATASSQASTIKPDEVHNPFRWHTEDKVPVRHAGAARAVLHRPRVVPRGRRGAADAQGAARRTAAAAGASR